MIETALRLNGMEKAFRHTQALDGVSFDADTGVTGLLGPNGAGKTTLLRIVATVMAADAGRISYFGMIPESADDRRAVRQRLGYMPQEPGFHQGFTAFESVDYVAMLKEIGGRSRRHEEVSRVLDLVGLADRSTTKVRSLSGGMRRRLALAQSLLGSPELVVLDEPTAGLDPEQRLRFRELVSDVAQDATVLLSTHLTEDVTAVCSSVVVIDKGNRLFTGPPGEFAEQARGRVWVDDHPDPTARLSWRSGDGRFHHIGDPPAGADLSDPSLEDAYLLLVGRMDAAEVAA